MVSVKGLKSIIKECWTDTQEANSKRKMPQKRLLKAKGVRGRVAKKGGLKRKKRHIYPPMPPDPILS